MMVARLCSLPAQAARTKSLAPLEMATAGNGTKRSDDNGIVLVHGGVADKLPLQPLPISSSASSLPSLPSDEIDRVTWHTQANGQVSATAMLSRARLLNFSAYSLQAAV